MTFMHLDQIAAKELAPGCRAQLIHSTNMTVAHWRLAAGAKIPEHAHPHEQVANVVEGEFEFTIDGATQIMGPGHVAVIPSDKKHCGKALTSCYIIDVFYPTREDYR
jgi:quercetin dioxygenase-like cupin family protein